MYGAGCGGREWETPARARMSSQTPPHPPLSSTRNSPTFGKSSRRLRKRRKFVIRSERPLSLSLSLSLALSLALCVRQGRASKSARRQARPPAPHACAPHQSVLHHVPPPLRLLSKILISIEVGKLIVSSIILCRQSSGIPTVHCSGVLP